jgi:beta-N-acetylhexosaminidase
VGTVKRAVWPVLALTVIIGGCGSAVAAPTSIADAGASTFGAGTPNRDPVLATATGRAAGGTGDLGATGATLSGAAASSTSRPTIAQLVGQKLVVRMDGLTPSPDLLGRIRRGEVGGVVLFGANISTAAALRTLTAKLEAAAAAAGRPRLLIAVDQEGGPIKRIPWAPPTMTPSAIGTLGVASVAHTQGLMTGAALRGLGINVDFAPVVDVPATTASFMDRAGRTWSFSAVRTSGVANAFATGLESAGLEPVMKHFPGIGFATRNTDTSVVTIGASRAELASGLLPYQRAIPKHIPMIMLSNATYPAYDASHAAGWSSVIVGTLLRHDLGFEGVTITDALDGTAHARGVPTSRLAIAAAIAGTDMILTTGSESASRAVYAALVAAATAGRIPRATLAASYTRILALKTGI